MELNNHRDILHLTARTSILNNKYSLCQYNSPNYIILCVHHKIPNVSSDKIPNVSSDTLNLTRYQIISTYKEGNSTQEPSELSKVSMHAKAFTCT